MDPPARRAEPCDRSINPGEKSRRLMRQISGLTLDPAVRASPIGAVSEDSHSVWDNSSVQSDPTAYTGAGLDNIKSLLQQQTSAIAQEHQTAQLSAAKMAQQNNANKGKKKSLAVSLKAYLLGGGNGGDKSVRSKTTHTQSTRTKSTGNDNSSLTELDMTGNSDEFGLVTETMGIPHHAAAAAHPVGCVSIGCRPGRLQLDDSFFPPVAPHGATPQQQQQRQKQQQQQRHLQRQQQQEYMNHYQQQPTLSCLPPKRLGTPDQSLHEFLQQVSPDAANVIMKQQKQRPQKKKKEHPLDVDIRSRDERRSTTTRSQSASRSRTASRSNSAPRGGQRSPQDPPSHHQKEFTPGMREYPDDSSSAPALKKRNLVREKDGKPIPPPQSPGRRQADIRLNTAKNATNNKKTYKSRAIPATLEKVFKQQERPSRRSSVTNMYMVKSDIVVGALETKTKTTYKPAKPKFAIQFQEARCEL